MPRPKRTPLPVITKVIRVKGKPKRPGIPPTHINWETVKQARTFGCHWSEVAALIGLHPDTLVSRAKAEGMHDQLQEVAPVMGRALVKMKLMQAALAGSGNIAALIHLDKKAEAAEAAANAPTAASNAWLVETRPVAATVEAWAEEYAPMRPQAPAPGGGG